jgi:hypothetical protein
MTKQCLSINNYSSRSRHHPASRADGTYGTINTDIQFAIFLPSGDLPKEEKIPACRQKGNQFPMTKLSKSSLMIFLAMIAIVLMRPSISIAAPSIIINHTSVDLYDDIPDNYINAVKTMWFSMPGESHSRAYYNGLLQLQSANSKYKVVVSANPGSGNINAGDGLAIYYTNVFGALWNGSSWDWGAGEEDWFYNGATKPRGHIQHVSNASYRLSGLGLGWCWDDYLTPSDFDNYISATQGYSTYAKSLGSKVYVLFTTGPVDGSGSSVRDEKYRRVRNYVASANNEILFDYADILIYNDAGERNPTTYEEIHPSNAGNTDSHIGSNGELRLAKAVWVLMARLAGWNGSKKVNPRVPPIPSIMLLLGPDP